MKKILAYLSLFVCVCSYAQAHDGHDSNWDNNYMERSSGSSECAPPEKAMNDCYCLYCRYVPKYYSKWHCNYVPQYRYKKCCRYVPQQYQKRCCKMVPQYYNVTCTRQVPQYYYTCQTKYVPKYSCEKCCKWVPQYYYKHVCEPTCGDKCVPAN